MKGFDFAADKDATKFIMKRKGKWIYYIFQNKEGEMTQYYARNFEVSK